MRQLNVKYGPWRHHRFPWFPPASSPQPISPRDLVSGARKVQFVLKQTPIATFKNRGLSILLVAVSMLCLAHFSCLYLLIFFLLSISDARRVALVSALFECRLKRTGSKRPLERHILNNLMGTLRNLRYTPYKTWGVKRKFMLWFERV